MMWNEIDNLFPFKDSVEAQNFCAILDKYKAMHKEESFLTFKAGQDSTEEGGKGFEQWYNLTYAGNK